MKNSSFSGRCGQLLKGAGLCLATVGLVGLICVPALETLAEPHINSEIGSLSMDKVQQQRVEILRHSSGPRAYQGALASECPCEKQAETDLLQFLKRAP